MIFRSIKDMGRNALHAATGSILVMTLAACGGGGGSPGAVQGATNSSTSVGSVSLIFSSPELKSAGAPGSEVTVTALVKTASNTAISGATVAFSADSGAISGSAVSDANGKATATLGISGDHTNRKITVTAQAGGKSGSGSVDVVGSSVTLVGPSAISAGGTADFTITVTDSANAVVSNAPVSISSAKGNAIAIKTSGGGMATAPLTNPKGQVVVTVTASSSGDDTLSVAAQGATTSLTVGINASKLTMKITKIVPINNVPTEVDAATGDTGTSCLKIIAHYEIGGVPQGIPPLPPVIANLSTSRGQLFSFSDPGCTNALPNSSVAIISGDSTPTYLKSNTAGIATITASIPAGPVVNANIEFIALATSLATISVQATPAVIGANTGTSQVEQSTLTAIVRDGTQYNNFVKNAVVEFSIIQDGSGGALSSPSVLTTGSNGSASTVFVAGTGVTPKDGVQIQAALQGSTKTATAYLTVSKKSLFIAAGTGNKLGTPTDTTYQQDYAVFITDAGGNPVPNVSVTATAIPTRYGKGAYSFPTGAKAWQQNITAICLNEDTNLDGIWDAAKDINGNLVLDPGIPLNVSPTVTTDATGTATISIRYPRDRANWVEVTVIIRGTVAGTEATYTVQPYFLPILAADLTSADTSPPGQTSPYGVNACNVKN